MSDPIQEISDRLSEPFSALEVRWKPKQVSKDKKHAYALPYVDARVVMERLDTVVGIDGWKDEYKVLDECSVSCRLSVKINGEWITKEDAGSVSNQEDAGDRRKSAFSDALKRAAVRFGIGRYIYRLQGQWVEYDEQKKRLARVPALPTWAIPKQETLTHPDGVPPDLDEIPPPPHTAASQPAKAAEQKTVGQTPAAPTNQPAAKTAAQEPAAPAVPEPKPDPKSGSGSVIPSKEASELPKTGKELYQRLRDRERELVSKGACDGGELIAFVAEQCKPHGFSGRMVNWTADAVPLAVEAVKKFIGSRAGMANGRVKQPA